MALTFDDGPGAHTGRLLDALKEYDAKATFFVVGRVACENEENMALVKRMVDEMCIRDSLPKRQDVHRPVANRRVR